MAFDTLPIELNEHIAGFLPTDQDVANFILTCRATYTAAESYRCGLWRKLFARKFDVPTGATGQKLKSKYKIWSRALNRTTHWKMGYGRDEITILDILKDMITDAYADVPFGYKAKRISKNLLALRSYKNRSNILDNFSLHGQVLNLRLRTLQLVLTHLQFDLALSPSTIGFPYSQKVVYGHPDKTPIFKGKNCSKIDIDFLMHTANFFKYHMTSLGAQTLYDNFRELDENQKPKPWNARLSQGPDSLKLGKKWLGSYAYLHTTTEMRDIRSAPANSRIFIDTIDYEDGFQTLDLDFTTAANTRPWSLDFESHLHGMPPVQLCNQLDKLQQNKSHNDVDSFQGSEQHNRPKKMLQRPPSTAGTGHRTKPVPAANKSLPLSTHSSPTVATPRRGLHYQQFSGSGTDAEAFRCKGILHPLPPQHGIPGWQRFTLMKYFTPSMDKNSFTTSSSNAGSTTPSDGSSTATSPSSHSHSSSATSTTSASAATYNSGFSTSFTPINTFRPQADEDFDIDDGCWAYEGVVLPGGKIILGRWWSPVQDRDEMLCMGPFIFWEVDEAP